MRTGRRSAMKSASRSAKADFVLLPQHPPFTARMKMFRSINLLEA
jgi:hypothetical protein